MDEREETVQKPKSAGTAKVAVSPIPKFIVIAALAVFIVLLFWNQSGSNRPFAEVEQAVAAQIDTEGLERADDQTFKRDYGLTASDYDGVMLYVSTFNLEAQEILLVKVQNDEQMQEVESAIDTRIENRRNDFEGYLPEQETLLDESLVTIRGDYIFLVISEDADAYQSAFLKAL